MDSDKLVEIGAIHYSSYDHETAYRYFLEAALMDENPDAIQNLGFMYLWGYYPRQDYKKALKYFESYYLMTGECVSVFREILDISNDLVKEKAGREFFRRFIEFLVKNEEWWVYINIADCYGNGDIYPKNIVKKIESLNIAIEHGIKYGNACLGEMYFKGEEVEKNYKLAYEYFLKNDDLSIMPLYYLGKMFEEGLYVEKDEDKAMRLYKKATSFNYPDIKNDLYYQLSAKRLHEMEAI